MNRAVVAEKAKGQILPGRRYHVYNRGAFRQEVFRDDQDCIHFLNLTKKYIKDPLTLLGYAILPNHFHLYIEVKKAEKLSTFYRERPSAIGNRIGHLQNAYAKYFRYKTKSQGTGAVFQGRYKRNEVSDFLYRRNIIHYLNGNAWHHGLVADPEDYPFTSLQEFLFPAVEPFVDVDKAVADFGGRKAFRDDWERVRAKRGLNHDLEWEPEAG